MKTVAMRLFLCILMIVGMMLSGCASTRIKQLSGKEFLSQAEQIEEINSFSLTNYIGRSRQRAYLEYRHPAWLGSGTQTTVYWTRLSELPDDIATQLKAGKPPWKPWHIQPKPNK